jgi:hypothetical protein
MLLYQSSRLVNPHILEMRTTVSTFVDNISGSMASGWLNSPQESAPTYKPTLETFPVYRKIKAMYVTEENTADLHSVGRVP